MRARELHEVILCNILSMYTFARGGLRQRVFAGECSVMHQWHPSLASAAKPNLLEFHDTGFMTAEDESPFYWNGSRLDVDGHLRGAAGSNGDDDCDDNGVDGDDDWGLNAHRLAEEVVAANAR